MISYIILIVICIIVALFGRYSLFAYIITYALLSWLCDINPEETYYWYSGIWHGICFLPNWFVHLIYPDVLYKANNYTTAYNVFWYILSIQSTIGFFYGELFYKLFHIKRYY